MELIKKKLNDISRNIKNKIFLPSCVSPAIFYARESDRRDDSSHPFVEEMKR